MNSLLQEIALLSSIEATLDWDQETYAPPSSVEYRAKQSAYLAGKLHQLKTSDSFKTALETSKLSPENLRNLQHQYDRATKLPQELVERASETASLAKAAWMEARETNDYPLFSPHLEKLIAIAREQADHWGYEDEPYDALLDEYEHGTKTSEVASLFDSISAELAEIAATVV